VNLLCIQFLSRQKAVTKNHAISATICRFVNEASQKTANIHALAEEPR
jgi:hypothetical protein